MSAENVTINAGLELASYTVCFDEGIAEGLMNADKETAKYGGTVTLTVKAGYEAENLTVMDCETTIDVTNNEDGTYTFTMPAGAVTVDFDIEAIPCTITYNLDGGANNSNNPATYSVNEEVELENPTRESYTFTCWTEEVVTASMIGLMINYDSTGNRTYTANWEKNGISSPYLNAPKESVKFSVYGHDLT